MRGRRLLFVTKYFPPSSGSGVQRGAKFVKYLLRSGWDVEVVTIDPSVYPDKDRSMVAEVRDARVEAVMPTRLPVVRDTVLRSLAGMSRAADEAIRRFRPDAVLCTAPDYHWAPVARAARAAGVPYVLDYPDPWTVLPPGFLAYWRPDRMRARAKWALAPVVERWCVDHAAAISFATEPIRDAYSSRFPPSSVARREVVTNGFDPEDFDERKASPPPDGVVRIAHVGSFGGRRSPVPIARALNRAASLDGGRRFELTLVGSTPRRFLPGLEQALGPVPLRSTGWVSHSRAIDEMLSASILWLDAIIDLRSASTGKIFEYLASGRPILALAHERSPAAELVRRFEAGRVVSSEDPDEIATALVRMAAKSAASVDRRRELGDFSRPVLARRMSDLLDSVARY